MSAPIRNTMLVANAGSGKTYALTTRMVKLLALGVEPRKIAALTFTKKAAGEFLDAVFLRLAEAALDPKKLEDLNRDLNSDADEGAIPPLDEVRCRELLAKLVSDSGGLTMGTIDSLFARIARSFPLESGLPGEFSMIGDSELERARTEVLASIFRESVESSGGEQFLDLVRKISRRRGERKVFLTMLDSVKDFHAKYLEDVSLPWGDPDLIWGSKGSEILNAGDVKPAADAFLKEIEASHPGLGDAAAAKIQELVAHAIEHRTGSAWNKPLKGFIHEKLCGELKKNDDGIPYFGLINGSPKNRILLRPKLDDLRVQLRNALLKPIYQSLLEKSRALHRFMESFEDSYHALTRSRGKMTFSDVTDLLSEQVGSLDWMASAGYRLDAKLDHWLLDEFQDTSRIQWKVLGSFIDEVIQDSGGDRSLFYVGDTKQAIYSWRGGDPKLFFEIFNRYNQGSDKRVFERELKVSYRSAEEIVSFVNKLFGSIGTHAGTLSIPDRTVSAWENAWREHDIAPKNKDLDGYVRWEQVPSDEDDENTVHERVARILEEVEPWKRNLSCGVLTRKNEDASSIAALLQARGIPVSVEGKSNPCNDNPLGLALLAAFRVVGFPEDHLSLALLKSSPLAVLLKDGVEDGVESFRSSALELIAKSGYESAVRAWTGGLSLNPFLSRRATDFLAAAAEYDESNKGSLSEFVSFLESHVVQEAEASGVVRVMTLHQSKGLTFDMSIVTGLDGKGGNPGDTLHLGGGVPPTWGCLLPSKDEASADPVMSAAREEIRAEEEYGKLCAAYVAMTRSKQALYVLTKKLGSTTSSKNFARLLMLTLAPGSDEVPFGNEKWYEAHLPVHEETSGEKGREILTPVVPCTSGIPHPLSPSSLVVHKTQSDIKEGQGSFSPDAADLGTEIHEVLSRITWDITTADLSACSEKARELLEQFLRSKGARDVFDKPEGDWDLWNEKPFDLMIDGKWISGCFDRVHVRREGGKAVEARIYDYKTNRSTPEAIALEYKGQMEQYRKAASLLLGIGIDKVTARTVPIRHR